MELVYLEAVEPLHFRGIIHARGRDYPFSYKLRMVREGGWYAWRGKYIFDIIEGLPNLPDGEYLQAVDMTTIAIYNKEYPIDKRGGRKQTKKPVRQWKNLPVRAIAIGIFIILIIAVGLAIAAL